MIALWASLALAQPTSLLEAGMDRMAAKVLARSIATERDPALVAMLGVAEARLGQTTAARAHLEEGVPPARHALEASVHLADLLRLDGDCAAAEVRVTHRWEVPPVVEARLWAGAALDRLACGDLDGAADDALQALAADDGGAAHTALAAVARARGLAGESARHLALAQADPAAGAPWRLAAAWALEEGEVGAAGDALEVALRRERPSAELWALRVAVRRAEGNDHAVGALLAVPRWAEADHPAVLDARRAQPHRTDTSGASR